MNAAPAGHLLDAAQRIGVLMARGDMSWASVKHVCGIWSDGNWGHQTTLCWAATDAANDYERKSRNADFHIRRAVRPLFEEGAPVAAIEEAVGSARGILEWPDVFPILREEADRFRANQRWRK